ncbi:hypothetical protein HYPBUDRAFT_195468 [Hyphopichia burtonii NRRL Y-1933]|uniref:Zn(2)-C6 fungal-type domain-containing protein n=1 Tax=Hyphopichia burtonii NRRL Y-1933 TaxID=984485 RepID=A0A1E4RJN0_9ASCO|nr:hypothetical protein HYPBUDRAFT_195468 [Hyphopichia burtonii NRRL Y-1933]ODV67421.1 hypothetical protein HYPBUDRAFT_195468 [Hyphopichia burtonii NRRL Y-1933]
MSDLLSYSIMNNGGEKLKPFNLLPLPLPLPLPLKTNNDITTNHPIILPPINKLTENKLTENNLNNHKNYSSLSPISSPNLSNVKLNVCTNKKRRQRLGPSCDSCRSRKVKCNAEITILSNDLNNIPIHLSLDQIDGLFNLKKLIKVNDFNLVISNDKLIKFKICESCENKHLNCCFSKGFTKEDILMNNKKTSDLVIKKKSIPIEGKIKKKPINISYDNTRKSSCGSCRKRKVKCVYNASIQMCEGCAKKGHDCLFDSK